MTFGDIARDDVFNDQEFSERRRKRPATATTASRFSQTIRLPNGAALQRPGWALGSCHFFSSK